MLLGGAISSKQAREQSHEPLLFEDKENEDNSVEIAETEASSSTKHRTCTRRGSLLLLLAKYTAIGSCAILLLWTVQQLFASTETTIRRCENGQAVSIRQEWRTLTNGDRQNYISALQCLHEIPSNIFPPYSNVTRWDDFAWTHYNFGSSAHDSAQFLTWHRWFVALFESSLQDHCDYTGPMPYWDWTLDWQSPEQAPVFDVKTGLGGNGNHAHPSPADGCWCVTEGPFADARIPFDYDAEVAEEPVLPGGQGQDASFCLARKFAGGSAFNASRLNPNFVSQVVSTAGYIEFLRALEFGPHNDIPFGINGTFLSLYAPADPIFWLHHTQLDRLWWIWQLAEPGNAVAYDGPKTSKDDTPARLDDQLRYGNLGDGVLVSDVINTEGGRLCYRYDKKDL